MCMIYDISEHFCITPHLIKPLSYYVIGYSNMYMHQCLFILQMPGVKTTKGDPEDTVVKFR